MVPPGEAQLLPLQPPPPPPALWASPESCFGSGTTSPEGDVGSAAPHQALWQGGGCQHALALHISGSSSCS